MMEFRLLIAILEIVFTNAVFSSRDVHRAISNPVLVQSLRIGPYLGAAQSVRFKAVSKGLATLHKMGLVRRKRLKRSVSIKTGHRCSRGIQYEYAISKQGHSYVVKFLWNPNARPSKRESFDRVDLVMKEIVNKMASSADQAQVLWDQYRMNRPALELRPIDKRFPVRRDRFTLQLLTRVIKERDDLKRQLEVEVGELKQKVEDLKRSYG